MRLKHSPSRVIRTLITKLGLGALNTVTPVKGDKLPRVFWNTMPDEPANIIACYDVDGRNFGRDMRSGQHFEHFGVDLLIRHESPEDGYEIANSVDTVLSKLKRVDVQCEDVVYHLQCVSRKGSLIGLGEEKETRRLVWSLSLSIPFRMDPTVLEE